MTRRREVMRHAGGTIHRARRFMYSRRTFAVYERDSRASSPGGGGGGWRRRLRLLTRLARPSSARLSYGPLMVNSSSAPTCGGSMLGFPFPMPPKCTVS